MTAGEGAAKNAAMSHTHLAPIAAPRVPETIDPAVFRAVMARFATGVTVITYRRCGAPAGMTANAFLSVSMAPSLVLVSVRRSSQFNQHMALGERYGVNFLADHQLALSRHFSGPPDASVQVPFTERLGTPLIDGSLAQVVARVVDIHGAGDHWLYIGEVEHVHGGSDAAPLIFYQGAYQTPGAADRGGALLQACR